MGELRAYAALVAGQWRSVLSYRASFVVDVLTNVTTTSIDIATVLVMFRATKTLGGFTLPEAVLMVGLSSCAFVLADFAVGNVDRLQTYVRAGTLDTMLVRPLGALAQLLLTDLPIRKVLRMALAAVTLGIAVSINDIHWTPGRLLLVVAAPLFGAVFFSALFILSASLAFWWVDSGQLGNAFTYGGRDFTSYPVPIYHGWFRGIFAYALGFGFVAYQPALVLLGRTDPLGLPPWAGYASPLVALLAATLAALTWRAGIRHYRSTGS